MTPPLLDDDSFEGIYRLVAWVSTNAVYRVI
jgi:hypothetical protein